MKIASSVVGSAVVAAAVLVGSWSTASAEIVCSGKTCWHVKERHPYPPEARVVIHEDNWRWAPEEKYEWREHEGRGYWRDDKWVEW
jgi:hypothetical protein